MIVSGDLVVFHVWRYRDSNGAREPRQRRESEWLLPMNYDKSKERERGRERAESGSQSCSVARLSLVEGGSCLCPLSGQTGWEEENTRADGTLCNLILNFLSFWGFVPSLHYECVYQLRGSGSIFLSLVSMCANCPFSAIYYSFSHSNLNWNSPKKYNSLSSDSSWHFILNSA